MNEAESMSMTPPLSPEDFILEEPEPEPPPLQSDRDNDRVACFCCLGEVGSGGDKFHPDSYWKSGYLTRLCNSDKAERPADNMPAVLFSYSWPQHGLLDQNLDRLFLMFRQQINEIQSEASKSGMSFSLDSGFSAYEKRVQINEFLQYLQDMCNSDGEISETVAEALVGQLHIVLLDIGRLSDLPAHLPQAGLTGAEAKTSTCHQCFHVQLDVYWRCLVILHLLQDRHPGLCYRGRLCTTPDQELDPPLYDQMLHLVVWDLISLAQTRVMNKVMNGEYLKTSLYSCSCVHELWLLILRLSQWRNARGTGESFWISVHHVLKTVMDMDSEAAQQDKLMELEDCRVIVNPPESFSVREATSLCLWIMHSIAHLYTIDAPNDNQAYGGRPESNYLDLENLLKPLLTSGTVSEACLRRHLRTVLDLSRLWEPRTNLLVILWNYFYKRLNRSDTFQTGGGRTLDGLASLDQTVASLYNRCRSLTTNTDDQLEKETSYRLFLRILSQHLSKLYSTGATQDWKQMKGRIYSKFHRARIQELTDGGLYNLTCLFLTLAITADLEDVTSKLCDFYDMLDMGRCSFAKRSVVWRGAFAMMLVYEERGVDISFLTDRMVAAFEGAVSEFCVVGVDPPHCLWNLLQIYIEGLQEVVEASTHLGTSEFKLICPSFWSLLSTCSVLEMRKVLFALQAVTDRFRKVTVTARSDHGNNSTHQPSLQHMDFARRLWRNVYPFVLQHAQTLTPPDQIADLAATFCLLALNFPPSEILGNKESVVTVFQEFGCSDKTCVSISCRFLGHTLSNESLMTQLSGQMKDRDKVVISAWFRCCLHMPESSQTLAEVTRPILQMSEVSEIFRSAEMEIQDLDSVPVKFLKSIEKAHKTFQSWQDKMRFQEQISQYFADVPRHVSGVVRSMVPTDTVMNVYRVAGLLVKHCAKLIYVRQDAVIPALINSLIVPHHVMSSDKSLNPVLLTALKDTLHLFLQGLSKLSFDRDPFIQRRLKDIVAVYLPKFNMRSSPVSMTTSSVTMIHPIVASLSASFVTSPPPEAIKFRHFIINLVINNFMAVKNFSIHPTHSTGWTFLQDLMQRTGQQVKARDCGVLLSLCLEYLLLLPDQSSTMRALVLQVLQQITEAHTHNRHVGNREEVTVVCEKFVSSYFKYSSSGVLKVLEKLAVLDRDTVVGASRRVSDSIQELERKRGVGVDQKLRSKYYRVLQLLGDKGTEEIIRLKSEGS